MLLDKSPAFDARAHVQAHGKPAYRSVTAHALLRYIERVQGIGLSAFRGAAKADLGHPPADYELVAWLEWRGVDLEAIVLELNAIVSPAIRAGARSIKRNGVTYRIGPDARLVTIIFGSSPRRSEAA